MLNIVAANNGTQLIDKPGGIFLRRLDQLAPEDKILLETAARVVLHDQQGSLAGQLAGRAWPESFPAPLRIRPRSEIKPPVGPPMPDLIFFNGLGGFTRRRTRICRVKLMRGNVNALRRCGSIVIASPRKFWHGHFRKRWQLYVERKFP